MDAKEDDAEEFKFDAPEVRGPRKRVAEEPLPDAPSIKVSKPANSISEKMTAQSTTTSKLFLKKRFKFILFLAPQFPTITVTGPSATSAAK